MSAMVSVSAQTEQNLKQYFEGKNVSLKIDMPATRDGVNVYPERAQPLNYGEYANRLKQHGTSIRRGEEIMMANIKIKDKQIEFQLGGGGNGTVGEFNIHFSAVEPRILPPQAVVIALGKYVDFSGIEGSDEEVSYLEPAAYSYPADEFKPGVVQVGPRTTYLREGLSTEEVVRLLGRPSAISQRSEKDVTVTIYEFPRSEGRVLIAEFVKNALVSSTMETRGQVAQVNR
jgi:outer membrane protein assembly factor BamE (lipoprotein component of BamABCDE complex)